MIEEYLEKLRTELINAGADPALIQDATYDAEEYLRKKMEEADDKDPDAAFKRIAEDFGSPAEVASSYVEAELTVTQALRLPKQLAQGSLFGRFFGVLADPHTYGALFYMFLSLATGIAYFTLAITGVSLSLGLAIMIFGIPVMLLFLSLVRGVSFIEGRLVEAMLGVRMPRRPRIVSRESGVIARIKWWFTDRRTWTSLVYMVLQLPLGIAYFTGLVTALAICLAIIVVAPALVIFNIPGSLSIEPWALPLTVALGCILLVALMHMIRGIGKVHGIYAKAMLVGDLEEKSAK